MPGEIIETDKTGKVKSIKKNPFSENKMNCCLTLTPSAKMSLEVYAVKRGFTGISALIEFWAHNLETMEGAINGKKNNHKQRT